MKYTYAYKTSDGTRHEASMEAASREAVFEALRAQGIRAIKVVAADGSKANGEVRGVRKRVVAALAVAAAAAAGAVAYFQGARAVAPGAADASPRHQIYGDPAVMEGFERGEFGSVLPREGDRILAWFAQPGRAMCPTGADRRELAGAGLAAFEGYAREELGRERDLAVSGDEPREARELKQIVNGMRQEMREYLANGNGTPRSYLRRLNERTDEEMQIFERTQRELESEESPEVWERRNDALRRIGLRTVPRRQ